MFSPSLVCGINACLVQLQDMHDMQENVRQSNWQLVFLQAIELTEETSEFYSRTCFFISCKQALPLKWCTVEM